MKITALALFLLVSFAAACGGSAEPARSAGNSRSDSNSPVASGNTSVAQNPGTVNGEAGNTDTHFTRDRRFSLVNRPVQTAPDPSATPLPLRFTPAREDSKVSVSMNADGSVFEVRVFKKHPQLAKVEATSLGGQQTRWIFYLRDGKQIEAESDLIANLQTANTKDLMAIAGLQTSGAVADPQRKPGKR